MLGPLEVVTPAGPLPIGGRRLRALLAILLLHNSQVVSIDRIIAGLWPGEPPRSAVENIRTYISQLRSMLHGPGEPVRLESHPGGYRFVAEPEEVDLLRFTTLADEGARARNLGRWRTAATLLGEALDLWRGAPLPELELGMAVRAKTVALEEQCWRVQVDWISSRLALGEHADLVPTLRELVGQRPLDEGLRCQLVTALYATGRTAEALAAFAEARRTLVDELGIEPGPQLRQLQAAVLAGESLPGVGAPGAGPDAAGPGHPPEEAAPLVGRGRELRRLRELLGEVAADHDGPATLVWVSGPPGVGKSATASVLAASARDAFPDGWLHVDLRGSSAAPLDGAAALGTLLEGLGLEREALPQGVERRRALYRALLAERRMVVVLDDAADAARLTPLVPGSAPGLLIVTSRRRLDDLACDLHLDLAPLDRAEALAMLGNLVGADRVRREPAAGSAIVEACGGLPAAIRIAAARLTARPGQPLRQLADRLGADRGVLDELSLDGDSLREVFDRGYRALDPEVQESFRMLGRLRPGVVTAGDLSAVLGAAPEAAGQRLERLAHEGLLLPHEQGGGARRWCLPAVLHAFARELLDAAAVPAGHSP